MSSIGERISDVRKARGYTQDQLAERIHVSRQTISHWENERALPDFESIKQLSQVLGYDFSSENEGIASRFESNVSGADNPLSGDFSSENGETTGKRFEPKTAGTGGLPPADGSRRGRRGKWWALAGVVCLLMVAAVAGWRFSKRAVAEIAVRPLSPVAYLTTLDEGPEGWAATFVFENESDVPFLPDHVMALYYAGDRIENKIKIPYSELSQWMDGDKMCRGDTPLQRTFSIDHMNMTRIECVLQGTDDNGHKLSARASVELVKRYPEDAQPQETLDLPTFEDYKTQYARGLEETAAGQAYLNVHCTENPVRPSFIEETGDMPMWTYTIRAEELCGAPFTVEKVQEAFFADGGHVDRKEYTAADLNWGDGVIGANAYKEWMGGLPVQSPCGGRLFPLWRIPAEDAFLCLWGSKMCRFFARCAGFFQCKPNAQNLSA